MKTLKKSLKTPVIVIKQVDAHSYKVTSDFGQKQIWDILKYTRKVREFNYEQKRYIIKDAECSMLDKRGMKFPAGLISLVSEHLDRLDLDYEIHDIDKGLDFVKDPKLPGVVFEKYQAKILKEIEKHSRGIFIASTGSGKSFIAGGIVSKLDVPVTLITTINKSIFKQLVDDFTKWFPDIDIGQVGNNSCEIGHITIALYQSLAKWDLRKYNEILELLIVDEVHGATKSLSKISKQLTKVYNRYGLTATDQKQKNDPVKFFNMIGNIGPIISEVTDAECSVRVTDVDVYMISYLCSKPKGRKYRECFKEDICLSILRNTKLLKAAKQLLLDKGKSCLFMVNEISQVKEVEKLASKMGLNPKIAHGKTVGDTNEIVKKLLNDKKIKLVIATNCMSTGTNIPSLDGVVLGSVRKSEINIMQIIGRSRRRVGNKDRAIVIDSLDKVIGDKPFHNHFYNYSMGRLELYKEKNWFRGKMNV